MRLTLRTLFAYLDDILEPQDAEDIGKRIEESEVASSLAHRVRDVMRRLRLEAPRVEETRDGLDPNTVAEYLDHILPDDRVPDFERVCLESDIHLAEVASCHQILALVLGEPAEVDPKSREHMYSLPQVATELAAMEAQTPGGDGRTGATPPPPPPRRPRPIVPDYLREPRRRKPAFPWAAAIVFLVGLLVIGWMVGDHFKWFKPQEPVAQMPTETQTPTGTHSPPLIGSVPTPDEPTTTGSPDETTTMPRVSPDIDLNAPPSTTGPNATGQNDSVPGPSAEPLTIQPLDATPTVLPANPDTSTPAPVEITPGIVPPATGGVTTEPVRPTDGSTNTAPEGAGTFTQPTPDEPPSEHPSEEPSSPTPTNEPPAAVSEVAQNVGRFVSDVAENELLLERDPQTLAWNRVPPQGFLASGHDLLAFPAFRPLIALTADLTIHLRGGTQIGLETIDEQGTPQVTLKYGRIVANTTVGKPETRLKLRFGDRSGTLVFVDPESRAAIEMTRSPEAGVNPETHPAEPVVDIYALSGGLVWESDDGLTKIEFKTPSRLTIGPDGVGPAVPIDSAPKWYTSESTGPLDRSAARVIGESIQVDRPVTLSLKENLDHRRKEVRWLAVRCLGYVGDYGPMVGVLDDPEKKLDWNDHIEQLQAALARGPETAAQVRASFEESFKTDAAELYRMLWGYTQTQLVDGQDAELVKALGHDLLIVRVLGYWNLRRITGKGAYYQPTDPLTKRQKDARTWERRQQNGEIRFKGASRNEPGRANSTPSTKPAHSAETATP